MNEEELDVLRQERKRKLSTNARLKAGQDFPVRVATPFEIMEDKDAQIAKNILDIAEIERILTAEGVAFD
jgi:hypothetical protein